MTVESVACGATHACCRSDLLELVACGAFGIGLIALVDAVMNHGKQHEPVWRDL